MPCYFVDLSFSQLDSFLTVQIFPLIVIYQMVILSFWPFWLPFIVPPKHFAIWSFFQQGILQNCYWTNSGLELSKLKGWNQLTFGQMMLNQLYFWLNDVKPIAFLAKWCYTNCTFGQMMLNRLYFWPNDVKPIDFWPNDIEPIALLAKWCWTNWILAKWRNILKSGHEPRPLVWLKRCHACQSTKWQVDKML